MMSAAALFQRTSLTPSRHLTSLTGCSPQTGAINSAVSCSSSSGPHLRPERRGGGSPRSVQPAVSLKVLWLKQRAIKIDSDSDSFFHLSFTHLFALVKRPFYTFHNLIDYVLLFLVHCVPLSADAVQRFSNPPFHWYQGRRDRCGCHDTRGRPGDGQVGPGHADLSPLNLSSMLIINPTYSALPESLHCKLTFSLLLSPSFPSPSLSSFLPFFFPPPPLLQQTCSRENNWRWGVWEKQELLPGAGRASHGRHESAERCGTELVFICLLSFSFSLSLSLFLCVASVPPQASSSRLGLLPLAELPPPPLLPSTFTPPCTWEPSYSHAFISHRKSPEKSFLSKRQSPLTASSSA